MFLFSIIIFGSLKNPVCEGFVKIKLCKKLSDYTVCGSLFAKQLDGEVATKYLTNTENIDG